MKMDRRNFIRNNTLLYGGLAVAPSAAFGSTLFPSDQPFVSNRPSPDKRTFISEEVEKTIQQVKAAIADKEVAWMFENCYPTPSTPLSITK